MKKLLFLLLLVGIMGNSVFAQKKSGTVYSEHEYIDKTKEMWKAFVTNDQERFLSFFADSLYNYNNDLVNHFEKERHRNTLNYWTQFENLKIEDNKPATPDAIEYTGGITWVHDWLRVTGIHKATGIILDLPVHMSYRFNAEGKIIVLMWNYNNDIFDKITTNLRLKENGKVFIGHPNITKLRKYMNAFAAMDAKACMEFFAPNVAFRNSTMNRGDFDTLTEWKTNVERVFSNRQSMEIEEVGYPDGIYYEESGAFKIISWWNVKILEKDGSVYELPLFLDHNFNKDGKIISEGAYYSTNHFE